LFQKHVMHTKLGIYVLYSPGDLNITD
jgi:hypothetical protein